MNDSLQMIEQVRKLHHQFDALIEPLRDDLWRYCHYVTGSPWDGEDLFQETLIKAYGMLHQRWHPTNTKSYLFRMATNTWIDHCRKQKIELGELDEAQVEGEADVDSLELEEAIDSVVSMLPPRQAAAFILMDVFHFKGEEVASMLNTTPKGVYASAARARHTLKKRSNYTTQSDQTSDSVHSGNVNNRESVYSHQRSHPMSSDKRKVIDAYLTAFNSGDVEGLIDLYSDYAHNETTPGFQEYSKQEMRSGSMQSGMLGAVVAEEKLLWGRPAIVTLAKTDEGLQLHDVQYHIVENGKIVRHKSYFFCKQFMLAAAKELNVPVQLNKPPVQWTE